MRATRAVRTGLMVAAVVSVSAGCTVAGPYTKWDGPGAPYQCRLEIGPMNPVPAAPPDLIVPVIGDLVYEACWSFD